jgi:hypothetical protein
MNVVIHWGLVLYSFRTVEVNGLSKINPGSNRNEDNEVSTAMPGMDNVSIPEPRLLDDGKFLCEVCSTNFNSKEDISHALARHQGSEGAMEKNMM